MSKYVTVSVKIPAALKEELQKLGVKPSKLLREVIDDEVKRRHVERIRSEIESLEPTLAKITVGTAVRSIREDRGARARQATCLNL